VIGVWRPIETAPKDGAEILGYSHIDHEFQVVSWDGQNWSFACFHSGIRTNRTNLIATHWMPLPEPPARETTVEHKP
jgi:hypothetical protein